jgi:hypothetical protein
MEKKPPTVFIGVKTGMGSSKTADKKMFLLKQSKVFEKSYERQKTLLINRTLTAMKALNVQLPELSLKLMQK